jgi:hypothetical protein
MSTKSEKIQNWLDSHGYTQYRQIFAVYKLQSGAIKTSNIYQAESLAIDNVNPLIGIFKDDEFIKIPDFENDDTELTFRERQIAADSFRAGYLTCESFQVNRNHIDLEVSRHLKRIEGKCE